QEQRNRQSAGGDPGLEFRGVDAGAWLGRGGPICQTCGVPGDLHRSERTHGDPGADRRQSGVSEREGGRRRDEDQRWSRGPAMGVMETTGDAEMTLFRAILLTAAALLSLASTPVRAEVDTVRIAMPYGLGYLPTYVVVDRHLIQQHAAAAGLGDIKVTLRNMASGPVTSDLILANDADIGMGGWGPAFIMWDKTSGANKVRGIMPLSSASIIMLSIDPRIKSLRDFRDGDKIGISAIKVTAQAVTLQMAAAKEWGW